MNSNQISSIMNRIDNASSDVQKVTEIIDEVLPNWLIASMVTYSRDYPHLQKNWETICTGLGHRPQRIVLVSEILFDDDHKLQLEICEYLTKKGYCIRRIGELIPCTTCNSALVSEEIWRFMRNKNLQVPSEWSNKCKGC